MISNSRDDVIKLLIEHGVVGDKLHKQECFNDALNYAGTDWQRIYPNISFLYLIDLVNRTHIKDVSFTLTCQAFDLIYLMISDNKLDCYNPASSFSIKIKTVFMEVYGWKIPDDTADIIRIVRNNVMHTGVIGGVESSIKNYHDISIVKKYLKKYEMRNVTNICGSFRYLVNDIALRILGLRQNEHLSRNLSPAWAHTYYGYEPGKTKTDRL